MSEQILYEYVGSSEKLKHAVVTVDRETDKSYFDNFRPAGGGQVETALVSKANLKPHQSMEGI